MAGKARRKQLKFGSLRWPSVVGTSEVPAYIRFSPKEVEYGGAFNASERGNKIDNPFGPGGISTLAEEAKMMVSGKYSQTKNGTLKVTDSLFGDDISAYWADQGKASPDRISSSGSINLYLPSDLQSRTGVSFSATEVGLKSIEMGKQLGELGSISSNLAGNVTSMLAATARDSIAQNETFQNAIGWGRGQAVNNFSWQLFNGVQHRNFDYTFSFVAKNAEDSIEIKKICDSFQYFMLPSRSSENDLHFYDTPAQWDIDYMKYDKKLNFHHQPERCYLTSCSINYGNDAKNSLYEDGAPMSVNLVLSFVEVEPLFRSKD